MPRFGSCTILAVLVAAACGPTPRAANDAAGATADATKSDAPLIQPTSDAPQVATGPVHVVITADNAYSFGYGDDAQITNFTQGTRALTAGDIFNCPVGVGPEAYDIAAADAPDGAYLYIVTWDDLEVTQGVIGQFTRDTGTVLTGDARFDVCGTGLDYSTGSDSLVGPDLATINQQIAICNAGTGDPTTTTRGWVNTAGAVTPGATGALAVGQDNSGSGSEFQIACQQTPTMDGVRSDAHWMWWDPQTGQDPFEATGENTFHAFLIFRLPAAVIIESPANAGRAAASQTLRSSIESPANAGRAAASQTLRSSIQ
jgi:hypothetical protein|nr:hypothetical protein [Kofleriaceae bacterium]